MHLLFASSHAATSLGLYRPGKPDQSRLAYGATRRYPCPCAGVQADLYAAAIIPHVTAIVGGHSHTYLANPGHDGAPVFDYSDQGAAQRDAPWGSYPIWVRSQARLPGRSGSGARQRVGKRMFVVTLHIWGMPLAFLGPGQLVEGCTSHCLVLLNDARRVVGLDVQHVKRCLQPRARFAVAGGQRTARAGAAGPLGIAVPRQGPAAV